MDPRLLNLYIMVITVDMIAFVPEKYWRIGKYCRIRQNRSKKIIKFSIRFHLSTDIKVSLSLDKQSVVLATKIRDGDFCLKEKLN